MYKYKLKNSSNPIMINLNNEELPKENKAIIAMLKVGGYLIGISLIVLDIMLWALVAFGDGSPIIAVVIAVFAILFALLFVRIVNGVKKKYYKIRNDVLKKIESGQLVVDEASKNIFTPQQLIQKKEYQEQQKEKEALLNKEYRMCCNVCGKVTCYTGKDLKDNEMASAFATLSALSAIGGIATGNYWIMNKENEKLEHAQSKVKDYSRCPHCNSTDISVFDEEQWAEIQKQSKVSKTANKTESTADELKKFKELLDNGVITQEEFDAKKKQLLGI